MDTGIPLPASSTTQCHLMTVCSDPKSTDNRIISSRDLCTNSYEFNQSQSSSRDASDPMNICANKYINFLLNKSDLQCDCDCPVNLNPTIRVHGYLPSGCQYYSMTICSVTRATRIRSITTVQPPKYLLRKVYLLFQKVTCMIKLKLK